MSRVLQEDGVKSVQTSVYARMLERATDLQGSAHVHLAGLGTHVTHPAVKVNSDQDVDQSAHA